MQVETPSDNARTGFSLPTVPWHAPVPWPSQKSTQVKPAEANVNSARKIRTRQAEGSRIGPRTPTPTSASASASRVPKPAVNDEVQIDDIPFPPCDEGENEFLTASDFADTKLMAAFAALDTSGNKAMSAEEIAAVCLERGWLPKR
jgi:hypothetical protein